MDKEKIRKAQEQIVFEEKNANITELIAYEDIVFFSLTDGGTMGCPGEVLIPAKSNEGVK